MYSWEGSEHLAYCLRQCLRLLMQRHRRVVLAHALHVHAQRERVGGRCVGEVGTWRWTRGYVCKN